MVDFMEGMVLKSEIIKILKNWLLDHIMQGDQKYCRFLRDAATHA